MNKVQLIRLESGNQGTFGNLYAKGEKFYSGELPWRENKSSISCIPPNNNYLCLWTFSPRFKRNVYLVSNVINRFGIRKHSANLMGDIALGYKAQLNGCIALGEKLGWIDGQKAVLLSAPAIRRFETLMEGKSFILEVKNGYC